MLNILYVAYNIAYKIEFSRESYQMQLHDYSTEHFLRIEHVQVRVVLVRMQLCKCISCIRKS